MEKGRRNERSDVTHAKRMLNKGHAIETRLGVQSKGGLLSF